MTPARSRLPNRRPAYTETLEVDGQAFEATVGFDPESGQPRELFLTAGKEGSMLNAMLADAAVVVLVALQSGILAAALAKSIGRLPAGPVTPADLEGPRPGRVPASPIGAAPESGRVTSHAPTSAAERQRRHRERKRRGLVLAHAEVPDRIVEALARSVGRLPAGPVAPVELDHAPGQKVPASPIAAALDLVSVFERERAE